jgi:hypothetical protein
LSGFAPKRLRQLAVPTSSAQGLFRDDPSRHDGTRRGADAQLTDDAEQRVGYLFVEASSRNGEIDSSASGVFGRFLDIRTDSDEMNCPALSWHLLDQKKDHSGIRHMPPNIDPRICSRESWNFSLNRGEGAHGSVEGD